jgi:hypothetical protein
VELESSHTVCKPIPFARDNYFVEFFDVEHEMRMHNPSVATVRQLRLNPADCAFHFGKTRASPNSREEFPKSAPGRAQRFVWQGAKRKYDLDRLRHSPDGKAGGALVFGSLAL